MIPIVMDDIIMVFPLFQLRTIAPVFAILLSTAINSG
jgi:hypothetical protein